MPRSPVLGHRRRELAQESAEWGPRSPKAPGASKSAAQRWAEARERVLLREGKAARRPTTVDDASVREVTLSPATL